MRIKNRNKDLSPIIVYLDKDKFEKESLENKEHFKNMSKFSPLSGSEPPFKPSKWNIKPKIKAHHNCYSYAINDLKPSLRSLLRKCLHL